MEAIFVNLYKAYNLPFGDVASNNDVFIELRYGNKKKYSSVKNDSSKPEWHDEMFIFSKQPDITKLVVVVWDRDGLVNDKLAEESFNIDTNNIVRQSGKYVTLNLGTIFLMKESMRKDIVNKLTI